MLVHRLELTLYSYPYHIITTVAVSVTHMTLIKSRVVAPHAPALTVLYYYVVTCHVYLLHYWLLVNNFNDIKEYFDIHT